jgi:ring-1,2-phenylacetyl-CoA epoxidase subunit PaaE
MSRHLANEVRPNDLLDVGTPMGRFRTEIDPQRTHTYVAFVAGSGITPVLSLASAILAREPYAKFELFYGNRSIRGPCFWRKCWP